MARYFYKAIDPAGKVVEGHVEAANEADLETRISNMSLDLIRSKIEKEHQGFRRRRIDTKELISFTYHLEQLLKAGVPLIEALHDLRDSINHGLMKDVVSSLIENIGAGKTFSEALAEHPKVFGSVYINMVHVGESSGQLVRVLNDLTEMLRWQFELTAKARKIMVYPIIVLSITTVVILFLMTYLVPKLIPFIQLAGQEIPWYTSALIITSEYLLSYWHILLILPPVIYALFKVFLKYSPALRYAIDRLKLKLPLFGSIAYKLKLARFCNYFALMYSSGITVLEAIVLGKQVINNSVLTVALEKVHEQISEGEAISASFARVGFFPALVVRMIRVGENTGAMGEALLNVSYFYDNEVKNAIDTVEPAIMPAVIVVLGSVIAWIVIAVIWPIYDALVSLSTF